MGAVVLAALMGLACCQAGCGTGKLRLPRCRAVSIGPSVQAFIV